MRCDQITEYLSAYIENDLEPGLRLNVDQHIEECAQCREDLAALNEVFSTLATQQMDREPPAMLHDNVMRRVRLDQREKRLTVAGWFASLSRGWQTAAAGAAVTAVVVIAAMLGPLHGGSTAGLRIPWQKAATPNAAPPSLTLAGSASGFRQAGAADELLLDVAAPRGGHWKMMVEAAAGVALPTEARPDPAGGFVVWEGDLASGNRQQIPVRLVASTPNVVDEVRVRLTGTNGAGVAETSVLLPVQTHVVPGVSLNWHTTPSTTVSQALSYLAGATGVPIAVPTDALRQPVTVNLANVPADDSIEAVAAAAALKVDRSASAYNLHR